MPIFNDVLYEFDGSEVGRAGSAAISKIVDALKKYSDDTLRVVPLLRRRRSLSLAVTSSERIPRFAAR